MSEATKKCQLDGCDRAASTNCFCCKKNVCTKHFMEHIDAVKAQIDPLANETNEMMEKIQDLTVDKITEVSFGEIQQWRCDMHQLIDEIFLVKTKEMEDLIATNKEKFVEHKKQQLESMMKIQDQVRQLAEDGDATYEQIQSLKNQLTTVQTNLTSFEKDFLSVNARVFAQGLVTVSSNLNKQAAPPTPQKLESKQTAASSYSSPGNSIPAQPGFAFSATPPQAPATSPFGAFGSGFQNVPRTTSSTNTSSTSGRVSASIPNTAHTPRAPSSAGNSIPAQSGFTFGATSPQPPTASHFGGFGSGFQNVPSTSPLPSIFGMIPTVTTTASTAFGTTPLSSTAGSSNNALLFVSPASFPYYNNGQK